MADAPDPLDLSTLDEIRPGAWFAPGRQMVVNDRLVHGLRFSRHITQDELVSGWLDVVPDFAAIAAFAHRVELASGGVVDVVELDGEDLGPHQRSRLVLRGDEGWLDGGAAGGTAVLSLDGDRLTLAWAPPLGEVELDPGPIAATFDQLGGGDPVPLLDLVLHLLIDHRGLFEGETPLPVRDLLLVAGLDVEGTTVVRAGVRPSARGADPVGLPGLGLSSALAAERLLGAVLDPTGDGVVGPDVLEALLDADAVAAVAEQVVGGALVAQAQLAQLVSALEQAAGPPHHPAVSFLRSRLAEWDGDAAAQEAALAPAVAAQHPAALLDAAWFATDRGDAREATALLRSAHVPADDPDFELLGRFTRTGPRWVGRNDACWCGSGRKHKQCHLHLNGHDLVARVPWLHAKAVTYLQRPPARSTLLSVATTSAGLSSPDDAPARVIAAACDASVAELCLFEGGLFGRFVEQRGPLLPDDERELAEAWAPQRHQVWEVVGDGAALRPAAGGDDRPLDPWSRTKLHGPGFVLAVVQPGPIALPGPVTPVAPALVDDLEKLLAADDVHPLAGFLGRELGWTSAPDLGSEADPAPDELAPTP